AEQFRIAAGIEALHVPYKGGAEAINDTAAGRLAFTFNTITLALPYIRDGRLLALGVTGLERSDLLPHVPTIAEAALPGFEFTFWNGLWAPAGTPAALAEQIARDLGRAVTASDVRERFARLGAEPMTMTPPDFARRAIHQQEGAVGRLIDDVEVPVAAEDARVHARGMVGLHHDVVARLAAKAHRGRFVHDEALARVRELEDPDPGRLRHGI